MINNVVLIGRLTRDPELRYTPTNVAATQFNLACTGILKIKTVSMMQTSSIA